MSEKKPSKKRKREHKAVDAKAAKIQWEYPPNDKTSRVFPADKTSPIWVLAYLDAQRQHVYCAGCEAAGKKKRYVYSVKTMVFLFCCFQIAQCCRAGHYWYQHALDQEASDGMEPKTRSCQLSTTYLANCDDRRHAVLSIGAVAFSPIESLCSGVSAVADKRLLKWMIRKHRPFSIVDDPEFRELMSTFEYKLPSRPFLMTMLVAAHSDVEDKLAKELESVDSVAICQDAWTSPVADSISGITGHYISPNFELSRCVLRCCHVPGHKAVDHRALAEETLTAFGVMGKLSGYTTDNEAAVRKASRDLCKESAPSASSRGCFLHKIQLAVDHALELPVRVPRSCSYKDLLRIFTAIQGPAGEGQLSDGQVHQVSKSDSAAA
jgi:hypothetical protein